MEDKQALKIELRDLQDNFKQVNQANSILLDEIKQLRGGSRDDVIWHQYFCAFINNSQYDMTVKARAEKADEALTLYKQRWNKK